MEEILLKLRQLVRVLEVIYNINYNKAVFISKSSTDALTLIVKTSTQTLSNFHNIVLFKLTQVNI